MQIQNNDLSELIKSTMNSQEDNNTRLNSINNL